MAEELQAAAAPCPDCGTELSPALLACPSCRRLVHTEELQRLAAEAEQARAAGETGEALTRWRAALLLLPPGSRQHAVISETVRQLSAEVEATPATRPAPSRISWKKGVVALGGLALLLWKFKAVALFVLGKGKLLLLGLTKASTLLSMALSLGVYMTLWGWQFALGFVVAMYVHEMGHVAALRRYGIAATSPMFIPGLGAFVRLKQYPATAREDARVGLAGPLWGAAATLAAYLLALATGIPVLYAVTHFSAWVNLFNLLPVWMLDGGRGFRSLCRSERWIATAAVGSAWFFTEEPLLLIVGLGGVLRSFGQAPEEKDRGVLLLYVFLVVVLSLLALVRPPGV